MAYINDVVVKMHYSGKGNWKQVTTQGQSNWLKKHNVKKVYIARHEENLVSAGMMRKASFQMVDTFYDPNKRTTGSRNTSVLVKNSFPCSRNFKANN